MYGIDDSGNYSNRDDNITALATIRNDLQSQRNVLKKLLRRREFNRNRRRKKNRIKRCRKMLNTLLTVNKYLINSHEKLILLNPQDNSEIKAEDYLDLKRIQRRVGDSLRILKNETRWVFDR